MAADDANGDREQVSESLLGRAAGLASGAPMGAAVAAAGGSYRLAVLEEEPLPPLPPVPPMPTLAEPAAAARAAAPTTAPEALVARDKPAEDAPPAAPSKREDGPVEAMDLRVQEVATGTEAGDPSPEAPPEASPAQPPRIKGWVSLDADLVFRGWAMKVGACDEKLEVALYIDDELVARSVAEDFRQDLPCEDKRHGFKFVLPTRHMDSTEHSWVVRAGSDGFKLSSSATTFIAEPDASPVITINRIAPDVISGVIECETLVKCGNPNVWTGADQLEIPDEVRVWNAHGRKGSYPFDIPISQDQFIAAMSRGLRVSIPGDRTGERATEVAPPVSWEVLEESLLVAVGAPFDFQDEVSAPLTISQFGGSALSDNVCFSSVGVAEYRLSPRLMDAGFDVRLGDLDPDLTAPAAQYQLVAGFRGVIANWDFGRWPSGDLLGWYPAEDLSVERRFASSARTELWGAAEDTALLWTGAAQPSATLLRQTLTMPIKPSAFVGLVARAAQKCQVEVVLLGEGDAPLARLPANLTREWQRVVLEAPPGDGVLQALELRLIKQGAPWIELAALDLAPDASFLFRDPSGSEPTEIILNPILQGWAPEEYPLVCSSRSELAKGWWVSGSKDTQLVAYPVPLPLLSRGATPGHFGLSVATNATSKFARLEARVDKRGFEAGQPYVLTFQASATSPIDGSPVPRHRKWPIIDRIFVMARDPQTGVGRFLFDCARRTYLSASRAQVAVTFEVAESVVDAMADSTEDVFLVLEFHSAFQITVDSFSISKVGAAGLEAGGSLIALEDADIIAQAATTKGCEHWISPVAQKWNSDVEGHAQPAVEQKRWTWDYRDIGTIEVVICVYNAIDETLQCLRSLAQSTSIPHTVSLIDDGSNANGAARLEEFIRDKPWMRMHRNPANMGYTRSADFGIRSAAADWVVLLNSDTLVSAGWIEGLIEVAASDPRIAMVGPVSNAASFQSVPELYDAAGQWATNELPPGMAVAEMAELVNRVSLKEFPRAPLLNGFCTLIRRSVFIEIGGLDATAFPMGYGEENDMCLRARDQGYVLAVADHVYVHHIKSASFGKAKRSELSKAGNLKLREKHPTTDFGRLGRDFADISALATLRQRVRDALQERRAEAESKS